MFYKILFGFCFLCLILIVSSQPSIAAGEENILSIDKTVVIQLIIFLVAIYILNKLIFKPFLEVVDKREKLTTGTIEEAIKLEQRANKIIEEYKRKLEEARSLALLERIKMRQEADNAAQDIIETTRSETDSMITKSKINIQNQFEKTQESIEVQIESLGNVIASVITNDGRPV